MLTVCWLYVDCMLTDVDCKVLTPKAQENLRKSNEKHIMLALPPILLYKSILSPFVWEHPCPCAPARTWPGRWACRGSRRHPSRALLHRSPSQSAQRARSVGVASSPQTLPKGQLGQRGEPAVGMNFNENCNCECWFASLIQIKTIK